MTSARGAPEVPVQHWWPHCWRWGTASRACRRLRSSTWGSWPCTRWPRTPSAARVRRGSDRHRRHRRRVRSRPVALGPRVHRRGRTVVRHRLAARRQRPQPPRACRPGRGGGRAAGAAAGRGVRGGGGGRAQRIAHGMRSGSRWTTRCFCSAGSPRRDGAPATTTTPWRWGCRPRVGSSLRRRYCLRWLRRRWVLSGQAGRVRARTRGGGRRDGGTDAGAGGDDADGPGELVGTGAVAALARPSPIRALSCTDPRNVGHGSAIAAADPRFTGRRSASDASEQSRVRPWLRAKG